MVSLFSTPLPLLAFDEPIHDIEHRLRVTFGLYAQLDGSIEAKDGSAQAALIPAMRAGHAFFSWRIGQESSRPGFPALGALGHKVPQVFQGPIPHRANA